MSLHDAEVAALAREAVDLKDPRLAIEIEPFGQYDPYRMGVEAWTIYAGGCRSFVTASMTWQEALQKLIADLA